MIRNTYNKVFKSSKVVESELNALKKIIDERGNVPSITVQPIVLSLIVRVRLLKDSTQTFEDDKWDLRPHTIKHLKELEASLWEFFENANQGNTK